MSSKAVLVAVLPKITGCLSIMGSTFNLCDILTDRKKKKATYQRLVAAMAMIDICASLAYVMSTWPIPADTSGALWASGNTGTCAAQGFVAQAGGLAVPMYNLCLTIYSGMVINLKWNNTKIQRYELGMHVTVLSVALGVAVAGFPLRLYNNANLWCWIAAHPMNCHQGNSGDGGNPDVECTRGKYAWIYRWAFFYGPLWLIIALVTFCVAVIAAGAHRDKRAARKFQAQRSTSFKQSAGTKELPQTAAAAAAEAEAIKSAASGDADCGNNDGCDCYVENLSRLTNNVLWQCCYYVMAFYLTWTFPTVLRGLQTAGKPVPYPVIALMAALLPMQGFFNALVFLRPRFLRYRRKNPTDCWGTTLQKTVAKTFAKLRPQPPSNNNSKNKTSSNVDYATTQRPANLGMSLATTQVQDEEEEDDDVDEGGMHRPQDVPTTQGKFGKGSRKKMSAKANKKPKATTTTTTTTTSWWGRRKKWMNRHDHQHEDTLQAEEDGNSSDEEDDQHIVAVRHAVARALADDIDIGVDDEDADPEVMEIRRSVILAMSAAIGREAQEWALEVSSSNDDNDEADEPAGSTQELSSLQLERPQQQQEQQQQQQQRQGRARPSFHRPGRQSRRVSFHDKHGESVEITMINAADNDNNNDVNNSSRVEALDILHRDDEVEEKEENKNGAAVPPAARRPNKRPSVVSVAQQREDVGNEREEVDDEGLGVTRRMSQSFAPTSTILPNSFF